MRSVVGRIIVNQSHCGIGHQSFSFLRLKSIDLVCMKKLDSKVNVIPIIAKADTISKAELTRFKQRIIQEIKSNNIQIYQFPTDDDTMAKVSHNILIHAIKSFITVGN